MRKYLPAGRVMVALVTAPGVLGTPQTAGREQIAGIRPAASIETAAAQKAAPSVTSPITL